MPGLMADNNVEGHLKDLVELLIRGTWGWLWDLLKIHIETFETLGLARNSPDLIVWQTCQRCGVILFTGNRNEEGPESLEAAIRTLNQLDSLPVITLSNPTRFGWDRDFQERVAAKLMEYLVYLDDHRGAGRLYVP